MGYGTGELQHITDSQILPFTDIATSYIQVCLASLGSKLLMMISVERC